jgi:outer membrane immunogenic protein
MKRLQLSLSVGLLIAAMAAPSFAADMPRKAFKSPVYSAPAFSWTGFYVGINGGYGWGNSNWSSAVTTGSPKPKGGLLGATVGYNMQTGVWVWGLEGDFDASWIKGTDNAGTGLCAGVGCETRNSWLATARGRVGYSFDRWLPFITGGLAFGDVKMTPNIGLSETKTKTGWALGAGVEYAFMGAWSLKGEYLYADLGKASCSAATCLVATDVSFKTSTVRFGVNYRF